MDVILVYVALISAVVCDYHPRAEALQPQEIECVDKLKTCVDDIYKNRPDLATKCFKEAIGRNYIKFN